MALGGALGLVWSPVTPRHFAWRAWHNLTSTFVLRGRRGTNSHLPSFCVAGVALMALGGALGLVWSPVTPRHFAWQAWHNIHVRFAWQAWHKLTSTIVLLGRRGTDGTGWRAWSGLVARDAAALCVAGVAQSHIHVRFAWQAWHKLTSTIVLRGRRGTDGTGWRAWSGLVARDAAALCVAGVAQSHIHVRFAWQAWHKLTSTIVLRGRRGTDGTGWRSWSGLVARDAAALCVAGVAQSHIHVRSAWQAWHKLTSTIVLRGRRGTDGTGWRACPHTTCHHRTCSHTTCPHTTHNLLTHNLSTHNLSTHNFSTHNLSTHNLSPHNFSTHNLLPHNFSTHNLSPHDFLAHNLLTHNLSAHTTYSHTTSPHTTCHHTTYSHTTSPHTTCHHTTCSHTTCSHTTCPHTTCSHTTCPHTTYSHTTYSTLSHTTLSHTQHFYTHKLTHTTLSHTALSPNLSCTISSPSCLSHLIFTSAWWSLEEVDLWGYPVLLFHMFLVLWNLRDTIATSSSGISPSMPDQDEKLQEMKAEATVAACGQTDNNYNIL